MVPLPSQAAFLSLIMRSIFTLPILLITFMMLIGVRAFSTETVPSPPPPTHIEQYAREYAARLTKPNSYRCYRTEKPPVIDGRPDEAEWQLAPVSELFTDIRGAGHPAPVKQTRVRMLWDKDHLYIAAELEEDDIKGSLTEHDSIIYHDNDFEVFIDPDGDGRNYFEIECNVLGTVMDLIMDRPYRSGGGYFLPWDCRGLLLKVFCDGTVNDSKDKDRRWFVEMAIPFSSLAHSGRNPRDYPVWRINFSRVQWLHPGQPEENWVWSPTGRIDMHMPERWGFLFFENDTVQRAAEDLKSEQPDAYAKKLITPVDTDAYSILWSLFYAQFDAHSAKGRYLLTEEELLGRTALECRHLLPADSTLKLEATPTTFKLSLSLHGRRECYTLDHNGCFNVSAIGPREVKNWVWLRLKKGEDPEVTRMRFDNLRRCGITAVLFEGYDEQTFRICQEANLEAHLWKWTLNRNELLKTHPEWYAINRKGESCYDKPAYVDYYRFLCPSRPEVAKYLADDYLKCSRLPHVDGIHLDYVRLPDVILPTALWKKYGIVQTQELPEYDYCYCNVCRERFMARTGRDPMKLTYPMTDNSWEKFRLDAVSSVVATITKRLRTNGSYVSAAVFPGPSMSRRMVRQDWGDWPLDACFPMIYNGFYHEGIEWIGDSVKEAVRAVGGRRAIYAGLMFTDIKGDNFEKALDAAFDNGAAGVSFFDGPDDEHLERLKKYMERKRLEPAIRGPLRKRDKDKATK